MAQNMLKTFTLTGGEDFVTPPLEIPDGMARAAFNYEQNYDSGYTRINGYRDLVNDTTPGEGAILGMFVYSDSVYIFRNQVGGATAGLWKAVPAVYDDTVSPATIDSNGSWTEITDIVDASDVATTLLPDGYYQTTLHNFKATTDDIGNYTGDWAVTTSYLTNDIIRDAGGVLGTVGDLYIASAPHISSSSLLTDTAYWTLVDWTTDTAPTDPHNVSTTDAGNIYGVDGKNPAFEFNGTQLKQIDSTYDNDTPLHIEANGNRLALGFRAGEIALSELGNPHGYDPVLGAGSIGVTDYLTGMMAGPDGVLYIFCKDKLYLYYGMNGPLDQTELKKHSRDVGAYPYTQQMLAGNALFYDTWGLTEVAASDSFGDVLTNSLSRRIQTVLVEEQPLNSVVLRSKAQYRMYFENTTGSSSNTLCIIATLIKGENLGFTHATYPFNLSTAIRGEIGRTEISLVGTDEGDVYQMDVGTNFDGAEYNSYLTLPFNFLGSPHRVKKFKKIMMNIDALDNVSIQGAADFSFGNRQLNKDTFADIVEPHGARWGNGVWNDFYWGSGYTDYVEAYVNGHGENISLTLSTTSALDRPHTIKDLSFIYQYQRIEH